MDQLSSDFRPHHDVHTEWWYFTGRLVDQANREHFYMLTFFRSKLRWEITRFAHFLLHSLSPGGGIACERAVSPFGNRSRIESDRLEADYDGWKANFDGRRFHIQANHQSHSLDLTLTPDSSFFPGSEGKIDLGTIRTHCHSLPRLTTEGEIRLGKNIERVRGVSWFDQEWGALWPPYHWHWWALNLDNGDDLVVRHVGNEGVANWRHADGHTETTKTVLTKPIGYWRNKRGARYPTEWIIELPEFDTRLEIAAEYNGCETPFSLPYWEGPCRSHGQMRGTEITGRGYMELLGYDTRMIPYVFSRLARLGRDVLFPNRPAHDTCGAFPSGKMIGKTRQD